jgi:hypothetical protein
MFHGRGSSQGARSQQRRHVHPAQIAQRFLTLFEAACSAFDQRRNVVDDERCQRLKSSAALHELLIQPPESINNAATFSRQTPTEQGRRAMLRGSLGS